MRPIKLECLSLETLSSQSWNLRGRLEPTPLEHLSDASFLGKLLVLPANVRLDWKVIASYEHSSLYSRPATCSWIWNVPNEKDRYVVAIAEAIILSTPFILLIVLHLCYVFMLLCWSLYLPYLPPFRCSASHSFSLSVSPVVALPLFLRHT
jgi:hypothetical protein